jgi:hypothetical protein
MKRAVRKKALKLREFERIDSISDGMRPVIDDVLARTDAQAAGKEAAELIIFDVPRGKYPCGSWADCRDLGQVFDHETPPPHPPQDKDAH